MPHLQHLEKTIPPCTPDEALACIRTFARKLQRTSGHDCSVYSPRRVTEASQARSLRQLSRDLRMPVAALLSLAADMREIEIHSKSEYFSPDTPPNGRLAPLACKCFALLTELQPELTTKFPRGFNIFHLAALVQLGLFEHLSPGQTAVEDLPSFHAAKGDFSYDDASAIFQLFRTAHSRPAAVELMKTLGVVSSICHDNIFLYANPDLLPPILASCHSKLSVDIGCGIQGGMALTGLKTDNQYLLVDPNLFVCSSLEDTVEKLQLANVEIRCSTFADLEMPKGSVGILRLCSLERFVPDIGEKMLQASSWLADNGRIVIEWENVQERSTCIKEAFTESVFELLHRGWHIFTSPNIGNERRPLKSCSLCPPPGARADPTPGRQIWDRLVSK